MSADVEMQMKQTRRRRALALKLIRQGHEAQEDRLNDTMLQALMQDAGSNMSPNQVMTMLQDLQELNYVKFAQRFDDIRERFVAEQIMLTSLGTILVLRRQNNENLLFA